jgi:hypothetical protein
VNFFTPKINENSMVFSFWFQGILGVKQKEKTYFKNCIKTFKKIKIHETSTKTNY